MRQPQPRPQQPGTQKRNSILQVVNPSRAKNAALASKTPQPPQQEIVQTKYSDKHSSDQSNSGGGSKPSQTFLKINENKFPAPEQPLAGEAAPQLQLHKKNRSNDYSDSHRFKADPRLQGQDSILLTNRPNINQFSLLGSFNEFSKSKESTSNHEDTLPRG